MDDSTPSGSIRPLVAVVVAFVAAGLVVGVAWAWLADPVEYTVVQVDGLAGLRAGEEATAARFGVMATYAGLAVVAGLGVGAAAAAACGRRFGIAVVWTLLLGAAIAALVSWGLGVALGPVGPEEAAESARVGSTVSDRLSIDAYGVLLAWPAAALAGALPVLAMVLPRDRVEPSVLAVPAEVLGSQER